MGWLMKFGKFIRIVIFLTQLGHFKTTEGGWMSGAPPYTMPGLESL
jgi:hypothetical protein